MNDDSKRRIVIIGASGGIGSALLKLLIEHAEDMRITSIVATYCSSTPREAVEHRSSSLVKWCKLDVRNIEQIAAFCENISTLDWLINCVGILHNDKNRPEKSVQRVDADFLLESFLVNTQASLFFAKSLSKKFNKRVPTIFLGVSAKVGSIEDNQLGGWYSYRVTKAALNMALKCLANEWRYSLPLMRVAAYHPGTTDTQLSKPFQANVPSKQLISAEKSAACLYERLCNLHDFPSGKFWSWNGQTLPW